ncbi:MAG: SoxR reducing system RseC family protein [Proteobacteria bacterium]|nr:SoxR reducing system RseC family protein [Pseudomonadota bacterium]
MLSPRMARVGVVLETTRGRALLSTSRRGVCEGCSSRDGCSIDDSSGPSEEVVAINAVCAKVGDQVRFDFQGHTELYLSLVVWGIPLVGLVVGAVTGAVNNSLIALSQDVATLVGALLGFAVAFVGVKALDRFFTGDDRLLPRIEKIIASCCDHQKGCQAQSACRRSPVSAKVQQGTSLSLVDKK